MTHRAQIRAALRDAATNRAVMLPSRAWPRSSTGQPDPKLRDRHSALVLRIFARGRGLSPLIPTTPDHRLLALESEHSDSVVDTQGSGDHRLGYFSLLADMAYPSPRASRDIASLV